jgi:ABC-type sugar transport system ATPase subunit
MTEMMHADSSSTETAPVLLQMHDITKRFPGVLALNQVNVEFHAGEVHCLVGENGAGKSTLMKIMSGVYTEYEGELLIEAQPVAFANTRDAQANGITMIHQELNLIPELTIYENIFLGQEIKTRLGTIDRRAMRQAAQKLMQDVGLNVNANRPVGLLRVGQQQLVEIAKALNLKTRMIIMDEPTSALSDTEVAYLFEVIQKLRSRNVAVIYISHRLDEVFALADRITVLRDGKVVGTALAQDMTRRQLISMMVGRDLETLYPKETVEVGEPVLEIDGLSLIQSNKHVLDQVSLNVRAGEIVGVAGLMGAGRTQLLEAIFGVYPANTLDGRVSLKGRPVRFESPEDAIKHGIGLVAEDRKQQSLVLEQSVTNNATLAALRLFMNRLTVIRRRSERTAVQKLVKDLNIKTPTIETMVTNLSGGNQQKVVLGKFLLSEIALFLLDEPTRGIDVGAKAEIYQLVGRLAQNGTAFLIVSSEMPELLAVCDRVYVMCEGRITGEFSRSDFDQEKIMDAATQFIEKTSGLNGGSTIRQEPRL